MRYGIVVLALAVFLVATAAAAFAIEGTYDCKGTNPGGTGDYQGTVAIVKNGSTYNVTWNIGAQVYLGTGLLEGDSFSVGYADAKKSWFGVVVYKVKGKVLSGSWAMQGSGKLGSETLTKR